MIKGMNGVDSLVSGWGGGHPKHCDHTQSPTPRPTDREALSLLPWTEATENVRDVLPQLRAYHQACWQHWRGRRRRPPG